ncbi:tetratricopeptide repeat protein [Noviherbaspirillum saxi]|uniref:Tetratricopeptide repeat protein n=1 Tax=Noviherbaspirillum saxi TaxID=2320863 RepID=A0A3A3FM58_9BURK|nr:tetratricopeptide repeat protein [Noviherbaspirillum saxi]RJF92425.1 tetratricopeptide repeat protein [Noviherbaspirillum saxi]
MKRHIFLVLTCLSGLASSSSWAAPSDPMQHGRAYVAEGEYPAAAKSYEEALRLNPNSAVVFNNLAVAKAAEGDYQSAIELLTRAQKLAPNRTDIRENLANLHEWIKRYGNASDASDSTMSATLQEPPALWAARSRQATNNSPSRTVCNGASCK